MSEAVTVPNLTMITSTVSEESLARDARTHARTHTHTHTCADGHAHTYTFAWSILNFFKVISCCSVPQLNTLRVTQYVHPHLYKYKCRYIA